MRDVVSYSRSFDITEPPAEDLTFGAGQVLLPYSGLLQKALSEFGSEQAIRAIAIKPAAFYPTPAVGMKFEIRVGGKVAAEIALDYAASLWPAPFKLKVPVLVARRDLVVLAATQPCTVVLIGEEQRDVR
jgi:hypothetical protein